MAPKGKKVERKEENISLGPQIREGAYNPPRMAMIFDIHLGVDADLGI